MRYLFPFILLLWSACGTAQNTRTLAAGAQSPPASIEQLSWLVGHWEGEGLGGRSFETISPPVAGQMAGHFQQLRDGKIWFYEIYQFVPTGNSLLMRLKHFNADLTGWEEKERTVEFRLVAIERDAAYFEGLTMRRTGPDGLESFVRIDEGGKSGEAAFRFKRVAP